MHERSEKYSIIFRVLNSVVKKRRKTHDSKFHIVDFQ